MTVTGDQCYWKIQIFCDVTIFHSVNGVQCFKETWCLLLQGSHSFLECLTTEEEADI